MPSRSFEIELLQAFDRDRELQWCCGPAGGQGATA